MPGARFGNLLMIPPVGWVFHFSLMITPSLPAAEETEHVRVVHLPHPLTIKVDGKRKEGVIMSEK